MNLLSWLRGELSPQTLRIIDLEAHNASLKAVNSVLVAQNSELRSRLESLENEQGKIYQSLLRRSGLAPSEGEIDKKDREFKPVKKTTLPWSHVAAKAEADSKERYWKKQIELAEAPQSERQVLQKTQNQSNDAQDFYKDMQELNNVSS